MFTSTQSLASAGPVLPPYECPNTKSGLPLDRLGAISGWRLNTSANSCIIMFALDALDEVPFGPQKKQKVKSDTALVPRQRVSAL